jgi:hypothetical protein
MRIFVARGLSYRPYRHEVGRTVQQFAALHHRGVWCLITGGHAMALIDGELFDAESKGLDWRKLIVVSDAAAR